MDHHSTEEWHREAEERTARSKARRAAPKRSSRLGYWAVAITAIIGTALIILIIISILFPLPH